MMLNIKHVFLLLFLIVYPTVNLFSQRTIPPEKLTELESFKQSVKKYKAQNNNNQVAFYLNKIAYLYWDYGHNKEAIEQFKQSLEFNKKAGNLNGVKVINKNIGQIYNDLENYPKSLVHLRTALDMVRKQKNKEEEIGVLHNIALILTYQGKYKEAITNLDKGLELATELYNLKHIRRCYGELSKNYEKLGDVSNALKYSELFRTFDGKIKATEREEMQEKINMANAEKERQKYRNELQKVQLDKARDSINRVEQLRIAQELEIQNLRQKDEIEQKERMLEQQQAQLKTNRIITFSLAGIIIIIIFSAVIIFRQLQQKRKAYTKIEQQNKELKDKNIKIEQQSKEIARSYYELEKSNNQIKASIKYASRIQEAILPSRKAILNAFPQSFIFYMPRDVVSGDFYWFSRQNGKQFIAAVDCTGHSVPGAFLTMIGNTLLNEIVNEKKIFSPAKILQKLNQGIIVSLQQDDRPDLETQDDGMDITIYSIDEKKREIKVATANHTSYIVNNNGIKEIKGDIHSIGGPFSKNPDITFTEETLSVEMDTIIYLFSDGYQDQFGGPDGKKFMALQMKNLLSDIHHLDMHKQGEIIESTFTEWKGDKKQLDDVLLIGIKIHGE